MHNEETFRLYLYAYPVTYFFSEVSDYPYIVGNSQNFDRMLYLWGFRVTKLRFGISVNGLFWMIMKYSGPMSGRQVVVKAVEFLRNVDYIGDLGFAKRRNKPRFGQGCFLIRHNKTCK